jgi:heme/copper-type cytochrome/quinol oxidase subunit 3
MKDQSRRSMMIWLYVTILFVGIALTIRLATWRSRHAITASIGTLIAAFAILTGFSIGFIIAPVAVIVIAAAAAPHLRSLPDAA